MIVKKFAGFLIIISLVLSALPVRALSLKQTITDLRLTDSTVVHATGDALQSLAVLILLSAAALTKEKLDEAELTAEDIPPRELASYAREAASLVLNEPSVWASLLAYGTATFGIAEPASQALWSLLQNRNVGFASFRFLHNGIVTLIGATGWEMGGELWTAAQALLENPEDRERAGKSTSLLIALLPLKGKEDDENRRVARLMAQNMFNILFTNRELRAQFFWNTWRKHIATGDFAVGLLSTVGSSVAGSVLFREHAGLAAFVFGVTGGVLSIYTPDWFNMTLTDGLLWGRHRVISALVKDCRRRLARVADEKMIFNIEGVKRKKMGRALLNCQYHRDNLVEVELESLYRSGHYLRSLLRNRFTALQANNEEAVRELEDEIDHRRSLMRRSLRTTQHIYENHVRFLDKLLKKAPDQVSRNVLASEIVRIRLVREEIERLLSKVFDEKHIALPNPDPLESYYEDGFYEEDLLSGEGPSYHGRRVGRRRM